MSSFRPLARLALRDARHHPWRSLLVVLLIALPVAAFTFGTVGTRTVPDTAAERNAESMGSADALVQPGADDGDQIAARLRDRGFEVTEWVEASGVLRVEGPQGVDRATVGLADVDLTNPVTAGIWELRSGRLPRTAGEVALTPEAASRLDVGAGDAVVLEQGTRRLAVTGILVPSQLSVRGAVGPGLVDGIPLAERAPAKLLVGAGTGDVATLEEAVASPDASVFRSFADFEGDPLSPQARTLLYLVGALALMAFGLVVASAMAVGARRQLRVLGLLGAAGASPRQRSASMLLQGGALGLLGVAMGLPGGILAWSLARNAVEEWAGERIGTMAVDPRDLVLIAVLALGVAVAASMLPARVAARTSVLQALGGRRPAPRVRARMPVAGLAVSGVGLVMLAWGVGNRSDSGVPLLATAGIALTVIGVTIAVPYVVGLLERAAGGLSGTGRLAVRDVARHRGRTGPVVAAVMATGALAVAVGIIAVSIDRDAPADVGDPRVVTLTLFGTAEAGPAGVPGCGVASRLAEPLARLLPGARSTCLQIVSDNTTVPLAAVRPDQLEVLGLGASRADLVAGRVVFLTDPGFPEAPPAVRVLTDEGNVAPQVVAVPAPEEVRGRLTGYAVADAALVDRWLPRATLNDVQVRYRLPAPVNDAQRAALSALSDDLGLRLGGPDQTLGASLDFDSSGGFSVSRLIYLVILPAALVLSVLVVLVGLALVSSDGRDERTTLVAVGAGPGHRRRIQAVRAFVLAGMGQLLALPVGVACAWVILRGQNIAFVTPWPLVITLVAALPVAAALVGAVLVSRDVPALQRRGT